jgi:hypothetical protein
LVDLVEVVVVVMHDVAELTGVKGLAVMNIIDLVEVVVVVMHGVAELTGVKGLAVIDIIMPEAGYL